VASAVTQCSQKQAINNTNAKLFCETRQYE